MNETHKPFPPVFATNRPDSEETVAAELNRLFEGTRRDFKDAPPLAIATAYINPGGFSLVADELERAPKVRLLLGAEPNPNTYGPLEKPLDRGALEEALGEHEQWLSAERDLTGFTRREDHLARRLVDWLAKKDDEGNARVEVRRFTDGFLHGKAFIVEHPTMPSVLAGSSNFTYAGLARNHELNLGYPSTQYTYLVQEWFNELWEKAEPFDLAGLYEARWAPHSPWLIFMRMLYELYSDHLDAEDDTKVRTLLRLTGFQREGVARMLRLLEQNGGVIVADEVGLGKTYMAGEVINRAASEERQHVLVVAPAALKSGMWEPFLRQHDFSRRVDVMTYDELRIRWRRNPAEMAEELDNYALVVVDEAHNLRNTRAQRTEALNALLGGANPKKLVLLTATPVNNTLFDLHALVSLFVRNDAAFAAVGIPSIYKYIKRAQDMDPENLSPEHLFDLMDQVAVRRTRRFIRKNYQGDQIQLPDGQLQTIQFPDTELDRLDYKLDPAGQQLLDEVVYALDSPDHEIGPVYLNRVDDPRRLLLARYVPSAYYIEDTPAESYQLSNAGLLRSGLLKRLESSPLALARTLGRLIESHRAFLDALDAGWVLAGEALREWTSTDSEDFDEFLETLNDRHSTQAEAADLYHVDMLRADVERDLELLSHLKVLADAAAGSTADPKAAVLLERLREIAADARIPDKTGLSESDRRKTIIFSTFADTVHDLHAKVTAAIEAAPPGDPLSDFRGRIAPAVFGSRSGQDEEARARVLARFAPETAGTGTTRNDFDLLITTDVLSEGVNLQQAGRIISYDLPWNPMRIVQRHGRIDRIGSKHRKVYLDCFFPSANLDLLLGLEERLHRKLRQADAAVGTGKVLPGVEAGVGQVLADTRDQINRIYEGDSSILEETHAALSGEEYRRRLAAAAGTVDYTEQLRRLPFASASGFVNPRTDTNGYVFCVRVGEHVRFRFVPTDADWNLYRDDAGNPILYADTLSSLIVADPQEEDTPRELTSEAYDRAFDAWEVARDDVHREWAELADGTSLQPDVPKALRMASQLLYEHPDALSIEDQEDLLQRLNTSPPARVQSEVRKILGGGDKPAEQLRQIHRLLIDSGVQPATAPPELEPVDRDEIQLVCWMAVTAGHKTTAVG